MFITGFTANFEYDLKDISMNITVLYCFNGVVIAAQCTVIF